MIFKYKHKGEFRKVLKIDLVLNEVLIMESNFPISVPLNFSNLVVMVGEK